MIHSSPAFHSQVHSGGPNNDDERARGHKSGPRGTVVCVCEWKDGHFWGKLKEQFPLETSCSLAETMNEMNETILFLGPFGFNCSLGG